jgi:hypothetical protein
MKIHPGVAELLRTDGWTDRQADMVKSTVALYNFANKPKKRYMLRQDCL